MSRAFTREQDGESAFTDIGERPVSQHRNLVTPEGLAMIDHEIAQSRAELARAEAESDREHLAHASRDLRYWNARRENAEVSVPEPDSDVVRFGMTVEIEDEDENRHEWKIVGEDEADAAQGKISHAAPLAMALFGKKQGELVTVNGKEWEILSLRA